MDRHFHSVVRSLGRMVNTLSIGWFHMTPTEENSAIDATSIQCRALKKEQEQAPENVDRRMGVSSVHRFCVPQATGSGFLRPFIIAEFVAAVFSLPRESDAKRYGCDIQSCSHVSYI